MKHKRGTKLLSILLSLVLMLGLLPTMVLTASAATSYNVWIGGVEVTSDNSSGTGWSYDSGSKTLTLNGYQYSGDGYKYVNNGSTGNYAAIYAKQDLTISLTGESTVTNTVGELGGWNENHGVFVEGKLTIQGEGQVTVNGKRSGIRSRSLQIDSGTVNASCNGDTFIDGSIVVTENGLTISGGNVTASGKKGIKVGGGDVLITGGTVNAVGSDYQGYGISVDNGDVTISGGKVTAISTSTSNSSYRNGIIVDGSGKKLTIGASVTSVTFSGEDGAVRGSEGSAGRVVNAVAGIGWDNKEGTGTATDIGISTSGQELNYKKAQFPAPPAYMEATVDETTHKVTFSEKTCTDYTVVTASDTAWGTAGNETWYVVNSTFENSNRITVNGTVNLILCDGAKLTASKGITVTSGKTLNIYAQSENESKGELFATGDEDENNRKYAAIGGCDQGQSGGTVNIHGGTVTANGILYGAGIGGANFGSGGNVTIYGGAVNATGGSSAAGIGAGNNYDQPLTAGTVTIYGGTVNATGGYSGAGIGGGANTAGGDVYIYGGTVTATGGEYGAGIGGGNGKAGGNVYIYGGAVTATGSNSGMGIGKGYKGSPNGTLEIGDGLYLYKDSVAPANAVKKSEGGDYARSVKMLVENTSPHTHNYSYAADGAVITVTCLGDYPDFCNLPLVDNVLTATLTIGAPLHTNVGDGKSAEAVITDDYEIKGDAAVQYYVYAVGSDTKGELLPGAPEAEGRYWAEITLGEATAHVVYEITDNDFAITVQSGENGTVTADKTNAKFGDEITLTVTPDAGYGLKSLTTTSGTLVQTALDPDTGVLTYVLTMGAADATVTAVYSKLAVYTIFYNAGGSPDAVSIKPAGGTGDGYHMTNSAKMGNINCWSTQVLGGAGSTSLTYAVKEGNGEWTTPSIPVESTVPSSLSTGSAVAIEGEANAFVVAFVWGEGENDSCYYLVTSNTTSVDVQNPANTASETFTGWRYLAPAAQAGGEATEVKVDKNSGATTTVLLENIKQTTIVSAIWTPKQCIVSFDPDNGTEKTSAYVTYGDTVTTKPNAPTKEGFEFVGWVLAKDAVEKIDNATMQFSAGTAFDFDNTGIINDLSLKAKWKHVHTYACLQLDDPVFGGAFKDYYGYKGQLHIKLCTSMDDYSVEAHSFVNGKCACGASILDNKVKLTEFVGNSKIAELSAVKDSIVSILAPQKQGAQVFSKWQYSADGQNWRDLSAMRGVAFSIPADMSVKAVYESEPFKLSINSFKYRDKYIAFQFDYSVPDGFTVVDGGLMIGDNVGMKFWDCTIKSFLGNQYEPSLRDAVSVYGGGTIANKMMNYQTINEPGLATPIKKPLATFGKTGTTALAWQPYDLSGYNKAINAHGTVKNYNQQTYPTYAMGYIICKTSQGGYVGFMTKAISATLNNPANSDTYIVRPS